MKIQGITSLSVSRDLPSAPPASAIFPLPFAIRHEIGEKSGLVPTGEIRY
jgi:hypothetical protein